MPKTTRKTPTPPNSTETARRVFRSRREKDAEKLVESTNALAPATFFDKFCPQDLRSRLNLPELAIVYGGVDAIKGAVLDQCLALIQAMSAADYRASEIKWSAVKKRREMVLPDMRYVVLLDAEKGGIVMGFVSFMITYEDGQEVVYCYELHLAKEYQGQGAGRRLMELVEEVARRVGVRKVMLTVFKNNVKAVGMYERLGYEMDEFSPGPRILRNGTVKETTYLILSKGLKDTHEIAKNALQLSVTPKASI